jgi:transposase-like protein
MSMRANNCPCCGGSMLLRHVRHGSIYYFCQSCRQDVQPLTVTRLSGVDIRTTPVLTPAAVS